MKTLRILVALGAAFALVSVLAVVALGAPSVVANRAAAAQYCPPSAKQARKDAVAAFTEQVHQRNAARAAYFKAHKSASLRKAYELATAKLVAKLAQAKQQLGNCH